MISDRFYQFRIMAVTVPLMGLLPILLPRTHADDTEFQPILEAEMPLGFPQYTPVQDVQIKNYPAYRKAEATSEVKNSFWTLFSHIKKNDIAMTAPVEMSYAADERPREDRMAFLYGSPDMGETGRQGNVEVIDVPPMMVISTGVRGPRNSQSVAEARDRLKDWLEANKDHYAADGQMRVMAYNSPFVPRNRNYFEVEIPIRALDSADSPETDD